MADSYASHDVTPLLHLGPEALCRLTTGPLSLDASGLMHAPITISCWMRVTDSLPTQVILNHGHQRWDEPGWSLYLDQGKLIVALRTEDGCVVRAADYPSDDQPHHVAVTIDPALTFARAYLDSRSADWRISDALLDPVGELPAQTGLTVGGYTDAAGGHFDFTFGRRFSDRLDELAIYGVFLPDDLIAELARRGNQPPIASFSLFASAKNAPTSIRVESDAVSRIDHVQGAPVNSEANHFSFRWLLDGIFWGQGPSLTRQFDYAGTHHIRLTVISAEHVEASTEQTLHLDGAQPPVYFTPVFMNGEAGYAAFRIPAIVTAADGALVAFAEGRVESVSDSTQTIHIVAKRSVDGGRTWGALHVVARYEEDGKTYAAMYPAPVVDRVQGTGRIILLYNGKSVSEWALAEGKGSSRIFCVTSHDHGISWSDPRDISPQVHRSRVWGVQIPSAGHALQMRSGRLFISGSHTVSNDSVFAQWNYAFWSDDLGATWTIGPDVLVRADGASAQGLNEAMAAELDDGRIVINSRNYRDGEPAGLRAVTLAHFDAADRLIYQPTYDDPALIDSGVQGALLACFDPRTGHRRLLFVNPDHSAARMNLTVRASDDQGASWPIAKVIDAGPSAYSDLTCSEAGGVSVLYERGNNGGIWHAGFDFDWLDATSVSPRALLSSGAAPC
ncbi:MAG: exo-alpha-sialidase [Caldilineaceae bacterium]|nr:exo-alpha-sialidase [Caldilineaceae bacterium]